MRRTLISLARNASSTAALSTAALSTAALTTLALTGTAGALVPTAASTPRATGAPEKVIVLLRDQHAGTPATPLQRGLRRALVSSDQSPVRAEIAQVGGTTTKAWSTVNAVAATVPSGALATLRGNPNVRAVVPDLPVSMPARSAAESGVAGTAALATGQAYCPTDPSKPQLEPEALGLTRTAPSTGAAPTARSLGFTGAGVTVGFIADGTDVNQPDLIRADGSHVVVKYQDFSGDGTAATTSGAEAMGDVGSIAAQGRTTYDIAKFVNPAHALTTVCNINVQGMAPGVSIVALKVFNNALLTAPTSTIIQAIDWAVNHDHVDVLNESFGSNPYPDNATDPISLANENAIDAGVTVVASTGDAGTGNTIGTAATDSNVIAVGASTSERVYAQTGQYGYPLSNGKFTSNQVSALSSGGISQTNRVQDLLAPGDLNWSLCSAAMIGSPPQPQYQGCTDENGKPSNIQIFGGTSESAPLTSGAAALVIEAYRLGHGGSNPSPAVVRTILDSTATDLGLPADEQGAGLLNSYRAVQLARDYHSSAPTAQEISASPPQLSNVDEAGSDATNTVTVVNHGTALQHIDASVRAVSHVSGVQTHSVPFDPTTAPVFLDGLGRMRPYAKRTFTVPAGTDRLDAAVSITGDGSKFVRATLLDPTGAFAAYTLPQGPGDFGHVDVHQPMAGTWTAIIWSSGPTKTASISGPVSLITTDFTATRAGSVSPAHLSLEPGGSAQLTVHSEVPRAEASAVSLVLAHGSGETTTVPIVNRAVLVAQRGEAASFSGRFDQANGRSFSPAQTFTYLVDVPAGARDLDVNVRISGVPSNQMIAHLSDPTGEPVVTGRNDLPGISPAPGQSYTGLQLVHANPVAGRWQLTLELANQSAGAALPQRFAGSFTLNGAEVSARGLPGEDTRISKRAGDTVKVTIENTSPMPQTYFIDARQARLATYPLVASDVAGHQPDSVNPYARTVAFPLTGDDVVPAWLVPTQVRSLTVHATATEPITFDLMPLNSPTAINAPNNPDIESSFGQVVSATHTAREVGTSQWGAFPSPVGPVPASGTPAGTVTMSAEVRANAFDPAVTSSTGDPLLATVFANAAQANGITIPSGGEATVLVTITPTGAVGSEQRGTLYVDTLQAFGAQGFATLAEEVAALPYRYSVRR